MDKKVLKWLFDVKSSIDEIDSYFANEKMDFSEYIKIQCAKELWNEIWK